MRDSNELHELKQFCNRILTELGAKKPSLSASITRQLKHSKYANATPLQRKFEKIRILKSLDGAFLESVMNDLNREEHKGPRSPLNCIDLMERMLPHLHPFGEITGGNYHSL